MFLSLTQNRLSFFNRKVRKDISKVHKVKWFLIQGGFLDRIAFFSQRRKDAKLLIGLFLIEYLKSNYVKALKG